MNIWSMNCPLCMKGCLNVFLCFQVLILIGKFHQFKCLRRDCDCTRIFINGKVFVGCIWNLFNSITVISLNIITLQPWADIDWYFTCFSYLADSLTHLNGPEVTAWNASVLGVILVRIFPHSDQTNSECGHFLRGGKLQSIMSILKYLSYCTPVVIILVLIMSRETNKSPCALILKLDLQAPIHE